MTERPQHGGWRALIAAKLVCCGGLVLFATGVLTVNGVGAWLFGGGAIWLALGGFAVTLLVLWRRHGTRGMPSNGRADAADTERTQ